MFISANLNLLAWTRRGLWAGAAIALSGCASFHPLQNPNEVLIRVGRDYESKKLLARDYAGYYVPYAVLALRAYDEDGREGDRWNELLQSTPLAKAWIAEWRREWVAEGRLPCPRLADSGAVLRRGEVECGLRLPGIAYQVWRRNDCSEIAISFRGTNFERLDDWASNLHWMTRLLPIRDQYQQVRDNIKDIVDRAMRHCSGKQPVIVAVGHSLGGGLAQQAAYADRRVRFVYAFDPSFVTGHSDTPELSAINSRGHQVDRIYEHGEILAYPRFILRHLDPASACDPQIRMVRFNFMGGLAIVQHSIVDVTARLIENTGSPGAWRKKRHRRLPDAVETDPKTARCRPTAVHQLKQV